MHRAFTILVFGTLCFLASQAVTAQNPPAAGAPAPASSSKKKHSHKDDFLMRGTVFTEKDLSLPGAELRVRRGSEKKFRWETRTNSRGEFAVRVPQGTEYELVVRAKGFAEQARPVDAKSGVEKDNMVFRMELAPEKKTGGKK